MATKQTGTRFAVDLGDVKLPDNVEKDIEAQIQKMVLRAIVNFDFKGELGDLLKFPPIFGGRIGPDYPPFPIPIFSSPRAAPPKDGPILTEDEFRKFPLDKASIAREHTRIVRSVMEKPLHVMRNLPTKSVGPLRVSRTDIANAAVKAGIIDERTNELVSLSAKLLPALESAQLRIPASTRAALDEVTKEISSAQSVDEIIAKLKATQSSHKYDAYDGLPFGIDVAIELMENGNNTIYSPDFPFYQVFEQDTPGAGETVVYSVAGSDAGGAVAGAVGGAVVGAGAGGVGAVPGAITGAAAGATTASVAKAVEILWDWIWE